MGSCLSVHKDPDSAGPNLPAATPVKPEADAVNGGDRAVRDELSSRFPSADDAFFDSQPWLESDGEDDFLSVNGGEFFVNGDFTPSRGSTPLHHKFSTVNHNALGLEERDGYLHEPHNPDKKKRLSELFKESLRHQDSTDNEGDKNFESGKTEEASSRELSKSANGSALCCFPSFSERKMKTSPVMVNS